MDSTTLLLRQVHPSWVQVGRVTSQVFRPTPKDESKLSVYDGGLIDPASAFVHFVHELRLTSAGVLGVYVSECEELGLKVLADPEPFPEHALIDFTGLDRNRTDNIAKSLRSKSTTRGWLHQA